MGTLKKEEMFAGLRNYFYFCQQNCDKALMGLTWI